MAVQVHASNEEVFDYPSATRWVIDDDGRLHVIGETGNLASYNQDRWSLATNIAS